MNFEEIRRTMFVAIVAKVSGNGQITAVNPGTCKIYVYAQNGRYKTISVTVK